MLSTKKTAEEVLPLVSSSGRLLLCGWTRPWAKEASLTVQL